MHAPKVTKIYEIGLTEIRLLAHKRNLELIIKVSEILRMLPEDDKDIEKIRSTLNNFETYLSKNPTRHSTIWIDLNLNTRDFKTTQRKTRNKSSTHTV